MTAVTSVPRRALRLAHRGDHRSAPENSIEALRAAMEIPGMDGVEFDVRAAADGVAILLHDDSLARVQGRPDRPADLSATELGRLGVPTLSAALAAVPSTAFLDIELKEDVAAAVVEAVRAARGDPPGPVALSAFEPSVLERLGELAPSWPRWLNAVRLDAAAIAAARRLGCQAVSAEWHFVGADGIRAAEAAGLEVVAWTVASRREARRIERLGLLALCIEGSALGS